MALRYSGGTAFKSAMVKDEVVLKRSEALGIVEDGADLAIGGIGLKKCFEGGDELGLAPVWRSARRIWRIPLREQPRPWTYSADKAEDFFGRGFAQRETPVHASGLAQFCRGSSIRWLCREDFLVYVVDHAIPLAGLDGGGDESFSRTTSSNFA